MTPWAYTCVTSGLHSCWRDTSLRITSGLRRIDVCSLVACLCESHSIQSQFKPFFLYFFSFNCSLWAAPTRDLSQTNDYIPAERYIWSVKNIFYKNCRNSRTLIGYFIINKSTDRYNFIHCAIFLLSHFDPAINHFAGFVIVRGIDVSFFMRLFSYWWQVGS